MEYKNKAIKKKCGDYIVDELKLMVELNIALRKKITQ